MLDPAQINFIFTELRGIEAVPVAIRLDLVRAAAVASTTIQPEIVRHAIELLDESLGIMNDLSQSVGARTIACDLCASLIGRITDDCHVPVALDLIDGGVSII